MATLLVGCVGQEVEASPEAVIGGLANQGPLADASEAIAIGGIGCSSTVISPYWQLTAAHCVGEWAHRGTSPFDACFVHPDSLRVGEAVRCEDLAGVVTGGVQSAHDLALLHRVSPAAITRGAGPPNVCTRTHADCGTCTEGESCVGGSCVAALPVLVRGFGAADGLAFPVREPLMRSSGHARTDGIFNIDGSPTQVGLLTGGDSGGTISCETSDAVGPVISVTGFTGVSRGGALVWDALNVAWIWSVLDPTGRCDPGATAGCILTDPYSPVALVGASVPNETFFPVGSTLDLRIDGTAVPVDLSGTTRLDRFGGSGLDCLDLINQSCSAILGHSCATAESTGFVPGGRLTVAMTIHGASTLPGMGVAVTGPAAPLLGFAVDASVVVGDTCGDGRCTAGESLATCARDCSALLDTDGDGLPDVRDLCPSVALASGAQHADSDGDFIGDDCEPNVLCRATCGNDLDYDGFQDDSGCDNCPGVRNPGQEDCDHDGQGDACDPDDADHDGVTDACDNCPDISNESQQNCNLDSELAGGACDRSDPHNTCTPGARLPVGDACDPNPCGWTRVDLRDGVDLGPLGVEPGQRFLVPENIRVQGVVHTASGADVFTPTGLRYCACNLGAGVVLDDSVLARGQCARSTTRPCLIASTVATLITTRAAAAFDGADPTIAYPWRRISSVPTSGVVFAGPTHYHSISGSLAPLTTDFQFDWDLVADHLRWRGSPYGDVGTVDPGAPSFPGVIWTHAPQDSSAGSGSVRELRSHYESGQMWANRVDSLPPASMPGLDHWPISDCVYNRDIPCLGSPSWAHFGGPGTHSMSAIIGDLGAIDASGLYPSEPMFEATDLAWTHAAEPIELLRPTQTLRLVSSSLDGRRIVNVLHLTPFGYAPRAWHQGCPGSVGCPPPACDPTSDPSKCLANSGSAPAAAASLRVSGATDPANPTFVLSASRAELFVIDSDGVEVVDLERGGRRALDLSGEVLGGVLAATYDMASDRLVVLDGPTSADDGLRGRGYRPHVRLIAIDPNAGTATIAGSWERRASPMRFALGAGPDGRLYLAASGDTGRHTLVSIQVEHHPATRHGRAWDRLISHRLGSRRGSLLSATTYASRFAVTFLVARDGHEAVATYAPTSPGRGARDDERDESCLDALF